MLTPGFGPPYGVHRMVTDLLIKANRFKPSVETRLAAYRSNFRVRGTGRPCRERPVFFLVLLLACFLAAALASQGFFYALPLAGLQVKRVTLYFLDNVLGLYLPFEPPQRVFEGFTLLKSNFRQRTTPPCSS